ncbi:MtrAB system histidine kinase MtrB [Streptomyces sp. WMMB 322]|uniref:MtrAB system histidine kinase MtrB n=1 Tax=Streptomyces sp. WMMB 322 TaxID=1286821 RepID=UPI0006E43E65|nr:MtrAB system histidine kinase MtrB [Streptomyces sp. WMMB 322]SCK21258.1 two-component system, OmpR family, sensor histidine kinase MtrB [Streptomyces sp. WMMB 322]
MSKFRRLWRSGALFSEGLLPEGTTGPRAHPAVRFFIRWVRRPLLPVLRLWRRNIQLRVVAATLLMSLGVVLLLGIVVIGQVRNGLLDAKEKTAQSQAAGGFAAAQEMADSAGSGRSGAGQGRPGSGGRSAQNTGTWLNNLVEQLASGGQGVYSVVALGSQNDESPFLGNGRSTTRGPRASGDIRPEESIPADLRKALDKQPGTHQRYAKVVRQDGSSTAGLIVGKRLNDAGGAPYQMYYVFPFTLEEESLNLVKGTLATAGVFVVVLLGAIAWLVVRQVVTPVRMAAGISERLAAGRLQERMKVTGEDDIARLGESFNKMAQNLQVKIQQLEELSRMQRRFVSDVSHELRTPLTTVRMAADVIHEARDEFDPATARSSELLLGQLDRFESLLGDLLEISRFDAGAANLEADPIDLRDIVRRVVDGCEPLADRKGSRILVRGDENPVVAEADGRRIERVLRNLVDNAIEHGEGHDVVVRLASGGGAVAVAVRDYGVGLSSGEAERVFNRFWRADPARARTTGGSGLGLSIALEDARLHGGWLQVWGAPGGGSQFRLTLPRSAGETLRSSPIPLQPADARRRRSAGGQRGRKGSVPAQGRQEAAPSRADGAEAPAPGPVPKAAPASGATAARPASALAAPRAGASGAEDEPRSEDGER